MEFIMNRWEWYIAGPLLGLFVPLLLITSNKLLGISSSFEHMCTVIIPGSKNILKRYDSRKHGWKFYFVIGIFFGGFLANFLLSDSATHFLPDNYYTLAGYLKLFLGGILIGFGTRYADGCTSGHTITGLSLLNPASLVATVTFFISGMIFTFISVYLIT